MGKTVIFWTLGARETHVQSSVSTGRGGLFSPSYVIMSLVFLILNVIFGILVLYCSFCLYLLGIDKGTCTDSLSCTGFGILLFLSGYCFAGMCFAFRHVHPLHNTDLTSPPTAIHFLNSE